MGRPNAKKNPTDVLRQESVFRSIANSSLFLSHDL